MAKNISRKAFFRTINIDDKIDFIEFYPLRGRIIFWVVSTLVLIPTALALYPLIDMVFLNGRMDIIIFMWFFSFVSFCVVGFVFTLFEPSLLIRFFRGDYFLKRGFFGRKVIHGNLSELKDIEINVESGATETNYYLFYCLSLKWKGGKQFTLGKFSDKQEAIAVARELCNRLKIGYVDKSQNWESDYWENIGRIWEKIGKTIERIWRKP